MIINSSLLESMIPECNWIINTYPQVLDENSFNTWYYNNLTENDMLNLELNKDAIRNTLKLIVETQESIDNENSAEHKYLVKIGGRIAKLSLKIYKYFEKPVEDHLNAVFEYVRDNPDIRSQVPADY